MERIFHLNRRKCLSILDLGHRPGGPEMGTPT